MFALFWTSTLTGATGNGNFVFKTRKSALDYIKYTVSKEYQPPHFTYSVVSDGGTA